MQIWFLIAAIVINLSLALVILSRVRSASSTAYFAISSLFVVFWATGTLLMLYSPSVPPAVFGLVLFLIAPMATTLYMALFAKNFAETTHTSNTKLSVVFTTIMAIIAAITIYSLLQSKDVLLVSPGEVNTVDLQHPWFFLYGSYFSVMFIIAYAYLLTGAFRHRGKMRAQIRVVLVGIFATSFISLFTNVLLPALGNADLLWVGPTSTILYVVATSYSMVRHGLFDLRLALVLAFTYGLSLVALAAIYYAIAFGVSALFLHDQLASERNILDVSLALVLAFLFQPIRRFFDKITSRIFYRGNYNVDEFFAELSHLLSTNTDLRQLLRKSADVIATTMGTKSATFLIYNGSRYISQVGSGGANPTKIAYSDARWLDETLAERAGEPVVHALLDDNDRHLKRLMTSYKAAVILPLVHQNRIKGYLFMGEHLKGNYTNRDIRIIKSISTELAIGIENALSVQEVKDLNANLEQRIESATRELRESNAQLQKLDESKNEFISMASHQLRTPLTSIKGYISMMMDGDVGEITKDQKHLLEEAFISSERMVRLIGDFLNVSRLQTGKFVMEKHPADLAKIVQQEVDALEQNAKAHRLSFVYKRPKNIPEMQLDEGKIQQVIMNFCDNAMYYSKEDSKIVVELKLIGSEVEFTVKDTGIGVPIEEQKQLFGKFFRATNARQQRPDGTGVGLFLAKKVVDGHHGKIVFHSIEGKGSTFGFRMPIHQKETTR